MNIPYLLRLRCVDPHPRAALRHTKSVEWCAIPNAEFYAPGFANNASQYARALYQQLSKHGQHIARYIVADDDAELDTGFRQDLGTTPKVFKKRNAVNFCRIALRLREFSILNQPLSRFNQHLLALGDLLAAAFT